MIIPIHYRIRYKNYPYAPKAKGASMRLGYLFCWPVLLILAFFWFAILGAILSYLGAPDELAYGIAFISLLPAGFALFQWRKKKEVKIEQAAILETQAMLSMSPEDRRKYDEKLLKDGRRILLLFFGGMILFLVILLIALDVF